MAKINIAKRYTALEVGVGKRKINRIFEKFGIVANPFGSLGGRRYEVKKNKNCNGFFKIIRRDGAPRIIYIGVVSRKRNTKIFIKNGARVLIIEGLIRIGKIKIIKVRKTPDKLPSFKD